MAARFRNEKYYRKLSKKERRQFRRNFINESNNKYDETLFKIYMTYVLPEHYTDFTFFITHAFYWGDTKEGFDYWRKISNRGNYKV